MRRLLRQTLTLLILSAVVLARRGNSTSGDPGNTRRTTETDPNTGQQRTVTSILDYAGGKWQDGRVREVRSDGNTPRERKEHASDEKWSQQDPKYQPQYGDLDDKGRASGVSITMNWQVREAMKHDTAPTDAANIPPGMLPGMNKGHLLGAQFGGSNLDARNFTPLYRPVNAPDMLRVENQVKRYMRDHPNEDVTYTVTPNYTGSNNIPDSVSISLKDANGNPIRLEHPKGNPLDEVTIDNK